MLGALIEAVALSFLESAGYTGAMEHKDAAIKVEMLAGEIEEIKANMDSLRERLARQTDAPVRAELESELADMATELSAREKDLAEALRPAS